MLRVNEVAALLGLSRAATYQLVRENRIGSVRIGKSRRIPAPAYAEFVARLQAEAGRGS
jgi:excisionase family DNA binding protein